MRQLLARGVLQGPRHKVRSRLGKCSVDDVGFSLIELMITMVILLVVSLAIPPIVYTVTVATTESKNISTSTAQASLALQNLQAQVQSASVTCLPTQITASGFTVRILQVVSTSNVAGTLTTNYRWDQWRLNTSSSKLQEEESATQTTTSNSSISWPASGGSPVWLTVATGVVNTSSQAPFSLTTTSGSPQALTVNLYTKTGTQVVDVPTAVAGYGYPYSSVSTSSCSTVSPMD